MLKDVLVWRVFLPGDAKYASESLEMETVEMFFSASHTLSTLCYHRGGCL